MDAGAGGSVAEPSGRESRSSCGVAARKIRRLLSARACAGGGLACNDLRTRGELAEFLSELTADGVFDRLIRCNWRAEAGGADSARSRGLARSCTLSARRLS